jgi:hypothetical protein
MPQKEGMTVPKDPMEAKDELHNAPPEPLDLNKFAEALIYEILNIVWLQIYDNAAPKELDLQLPTTPVQYFDPVDNPPSKRKIYDEKSYALPQKKLFFMGSEKAVQDYMKVLSFFADKLTEEERKEFFVHLVKSAAGFGVDTSKLEEEMSKKGLSMSQVLEFSSEYAVPRLEMLPLSSREQIIAAMSRCMHIKEKLTDSEKEFMVVNILKAAQKYNIDCKNFRERVKKTTL